MATDQIDNVIGYLIELKKLKSHLELKDEEIRKYVDLLLTRKSNDYDQSFMIYSYETDEDEINIIGQHLMEFSEIVYDHHYLLIARKEINRNLGIYLMPFEGDCNLETTLEAIEELIKRKRTESENESFSVPSKKIVPEMKMMTNKMADVDRNIEKMQEEARNVQQTLEEFKTQSNAKLIEIKNNFESSLEKLQFSLVNKEVLVNRFYKQRNLEYIRNSPLILVKMYMRLSVKNYGDSSVEPPFKDILSMEDKKNELIGYFDLVQKNLDGSTEATEIQKKIKEWMEFNWPQLLYKPTTSEKEKWKKEMEEKLKVKNTIGTVSYITFIWNGSDYYFFFCIANSKIIDFHFGPNKGEALKNVYDSLKSLEWDTSTKFATDMEVSDDLSEYFVHVSTDEIMKMTDNQKVMEWMTNNFDSLKYSFKENYHHSFPAIYNLALNYFEESMEQ